MSINNYKTYRQRAGLTQKQLAEAMDKSISFIADLENNRRKFTLCTFSEWAEILHLNEKEIASVVNPSRFKLK